MIISVCMLSVQQKTQLGSTQHDYLGVYALGPAKDTIKQYLT